MTKETKVKDKISYSAMAGELRKGARLYEVFKSASEAADILASFEKEIGAAKRKMTNLNKELESLDEACDIAYNKQKEAEEKVKAAEVNAGGIVQRANIEAGKIKDKAASDIAKSKEDAQSILDGITNKTEAAKKDMQKAINQKQDAISTLSKVEKEIETAKKKFLKTLG